MLRITYIFFFFSCLLFSADIEFYIHPYSRDSIKCKINYRYSSFELKSLELNFVLLEKKEVISDLKHKPGIFDDLSNQIIGSFDFILPNENKTYILKHPVGDKRIKIKEKDYSNYLLSDIEIHFQIDRYSKDTTRSKQFQSGELFLLPNSSHEIAGGENFLRYSFIVSNLASSEKSYSLEHTILDGVERVKYREVYNNISDTNKLKYFTNMISLNELSTGTYFLEVKLKDEKKGNLISKNKTKFFYLTKEKPPELDSRFTEDELFERSIYVTMDDEMVEREYNQMRFLLNQEEKNMYKQLSGIKAKRRALYKFWYYRDPDPTTEINERRLEFDKAINYADVYYKEPLREGWDSDRGRILLEYGFPIQVDLYEQKGERKACEVWWFGSQYGGMYFYFVELTNNNDFVLVHSTVPYEVQDEGWIERYNPAIDDINQIERDPNYQRYGNENR